MTDIASEQKVGEVGQMTANQRTKTTIPTSTRELLKLLLLDGCIIIGGAVGCIT